MEDNLITNEISSKALSTEGYTIKSIYLCRKYCCNIMKINAEKEKKF